MNLTPGGDAGVYHTTIIDGPIFQNRLEITESERILKEGWWFLNIFNTEERPSHHKDLPSSGLSS